MSDNIQDSRIWQRPELFPKSVSSVPEATVQQKVEPKKKNGWLSGGLGIGIVVVFPALYMIGLAAISLAVGEPVHVIRAYPSWVGVQRTVIRSEAGEWSEKYSSPRRFFYQSNVPCEFKLEPDHSFRIRGIGGQAVEMTVTH